jgi:predicted phosphoribosyltransferase
MRFANRSNAGQLLAKRLQRYRGQEAVVFALPRGGVVTGVEVARALGLPLDLAIPRKIGHPRQSEYAIAAVGEHGELALNEFEVSRVDPVWFRAAVDRERQEARRRRQTYLGGRASPPLAGKIAIVVDDGIATGLTMLAAIRDLKRAHPKRLVVAAPVAPADTVERLAREADEVMVLEGGEDFLGAVGAYYDEFSQVSDDEVVALMQHAPRVEALGAAP